MANQEVNKNSISRAAFIKSIIKFSISSWINFIISVIAVIITTRVFAPDILGLVTIFNTTSGLIMSFVCMGFDSSYIRFFNEPPNGFNKFNLFILCIGIPMILIMIIGTISSLFFYKTISFFLFQKVSWFITIMLFINVMSLIVLRYLTIKYRMDDKVFMFTLLSILVQFFSKVFVIIAALFSPSYNTVIGFNVVGIFFISIFISIFAFKKILVENKRITNLEIQSNPKKSFKKEIKPIIMFAIYSWPVPIVIYLNAFFSQIIISKQLSTYEVGIYSSVNIFIGALSVIVAGFGNYWSSFMFANYKTEQKLITKVHNYAQLGVLMVMCFIIIFRDIIYLGLGKQYHDSKQFFALAIIYTLLLLLCETTSYGISISKKVYFTVIAMGLAAIVNLVLCLYFIPKIGVSGAAFASALSGITMFTIQTIIGQKYYKSIEKPLTTSLTVFLLFGMSILNYFFYNEILLIPVVVCIGIFIMCIFKKEICEIKKIRNKSEKSTL